jgi:hypothetical protein
MTIKLKKGISWKNLEVGKEYILVLTKDEGLVLVTRIKIIEELGYHTRKVENICRDNIKSHLLLEDYNTLPNSDFKSPYYQCYYPI